MMLGVMIQRDKCYY